MNIVSPELKRVESGGQTCDSRLSCTRNATGDRPDFGRGRPQGRPFCFAAVTASATMTSSQMHAPPSCPALLGFGLCRPVSALPAVQSIVNYRATNQTAFIFLLGGLCSGICAAYRAGEAA